MEGNGGNPKRVKWGERLNKFQSIKKFFSHFGLFLALIIYTGGGAWVFQHLEYDEEINHLTSMQIMLYEARNNFTSTLLTLNGLSNDTLETALQEYESIISFVTTNGLQMSATEINSNWDYIQSAFFASTVLTTIGYGNISPKTYKGRLFCIFFAIIGIPLTLTVIADLGKLMASGVSSSYKKLKKHLPDKLTTKSSKLSKFGKSATVGAAVGLLILYISVGGFLFTLWEPWSFFESFYFCFITMTTIGFGDLVPDKTTYMLLCTVYIMIGLALTSTAIELVRIQYADSWRKMRELSTRLHLADTFKRYGDINMDVNVLQDLKDLKKILAMNGRRREGSIWKKFWENEDAMDDNENESGEPKLIQIIIYESSV